MIRDLVNMFKPSHLGESNVGRFFSEALTADVQAVLADQTSLVLADAAIPSSSAPDHFKACPPFSRAQFLPLCLLQLSSDVP